VSNSDTNAWNESLGQVIADLDLLNHNTEQDFLRIGEKLVEFIQSVDLISSDLSALTNWEAGLSASRELTHSLDRSMEMSSRHTVSHGNLGGMRHEAGLLKQTLSGFQDIVQTFHTIGLLTRIETTRLGSGAGREFSDLADNVKSLATNVQARIESALNIADSLVPPIEKARQEIASLQEEQAKYLPSLISETQASLSSLRYAESRGHDSSVRLEAQYKAISEAFKKLIVSVQFHDITRQQLEHVMESLRHLHADSTEKNGSIVRDPRGVAIVLTLQSSQLGDAADKFAVAVASVIHNLDDIGTRVLEMAEESRTLSGLSEHGNNSFFLQIEQGCTAILSSLVDCNRAEATTLAARTGLAETIGRMRGPIEQIEKFENRMHLVALNARICASNLGESGTALSALADLMKERAVESRERTGALIKVLDAMSEASATSGPGEFDSASELGSLDRCMKEMGAAVQDLHVSTEQSFSRIAQVIARGAHLGENISQTRKGFSVGVVFSQSISRARKTLEEVEEGLQTGVSCDVEIAMESTLADFAKHYTMQAEREVHQGVTRVVAVPTGMQAKTYDIAYQETEEIGENVEFF
jgi:methyl-accepting chemotaxis protein